MYVEVLDRFLFLLFWLCFFAQAVMDYTFKRTDYPVILSLENHCSFPQQQKMAQRVKNRPRAMLGCCFWAPYVL